MRSNVSFVLGQGQLGQSAQGTDFISGQVFYGTAPGSFATTAVQAVFSVQDAETKGIVNTHLGETKAVAIYTVSGTVTLGDTFAMAVTEPLPNGTSQVVSLGTATVSTAATPTGAGTDISAAINAGTYLHGYTATPTAGAVAITARAGTGISLNSGTPLAVTVTGTSTGTITQQFGTGTGGATTGVYSKCDIWHYVVSEFFRANPTGKLWIGFYSSVSIAANIIALQAASGGECSQIGVFDPTVTSASAFSTNLAACQSAYDSMFAAYTPAYVHYSPNIKAISDLSTLVNQQTAGIVDKGVMPVIAQDGNAAGAYLFVVSGISIGNVGCSIGTTSAAAVNQNIGEIGAFNISNGTEMAIPAFTNGTLVSNVASGLLDTLDAYRYLFATTIPRVTGTYFNNDWSAIAFSSDYNRQSRVRVINKVVSQTYINIVPLLKSRIRLNSDGTISFQAIQAFDAAVLPVKTSMVSAGEISDMAITINPAQNVVSTGKVVVGVKILPTATADYIEVDLSFTNKI